MMDSDPIPGAIREVIREALAAGGTLVAPRSGAERDAFVEVHDVVIAVSANGDLTTIKGRQHFGGTPSGRIMPRRIGLLPLADHESALALADRYRDAADGPEFLN